MGWRWLAGLTMLALTHGVAMGQEGRTDIGFLTCSLAESEDAQGGSEAAPQRQSREMLCAFKPSSGPEETYSGSFQSIGQDQELFARGAMIWVVKAMSATPGSPGLLQQVYLADPGAAPGHAPPLIGETNASIVLQAMAERQAPSGVGKQQEPASTLIVLVALKLKTTPT